MVVTMESPQMLNWITQVALLWTEVAMYLSPIRGTIEFER